MADALKRVVSDAQFEKFVEVRGHVVDRLLEGCQVIGPDFRYLYVNGAAAEHGKAARASLIGRTMMDCYPGIERTEMYKLLRRCMESKTPATMENEFSFPDETRGWFELRFEPVPEGIAILSLDITERKRTEVALRRAARALETLSRCNQALVRTTSEHAFAQEVCDLLVESGGYQFASMDWAPAEGTPAADGKRSAQSGQLDELSRLSGHSVSVSITVEGVVIGALTVSSREQGPEVFDVDERALVREVASDVGYGIGVLRSREALEKTQEQFLAAQKLEAVGQLAGGVAHDFNNLLSVILSYTWFASKEVDDPAVCSDIDMIRNAGQRAAALTRQLLAFSRKQVLEPQSTNINDVIGGIEEMLRRLIGDDLSIELHLAPDLGNVMADRGQLEQVIMNLAVNARDAMPQGGRLVVETNNAELDGEYPGPATSVEPGRYVLLSISDTGMGMTAEIQQHIFEPFFTTKERGRGTGLGLSTVYGIVKQSGGDVWVYSEVERGTTFKIYLPRIDEPAAESRPTRQVAVATGKETVLIVEDDEWVRMATERILRIVGYDVLSAANGEEALLSCEARKKPVDLLLTDMVMPRMGGYELAESLRRRSPNLRVLFFSGYTDRTIAEHSNDQVPQRFLGKPFSAAELTNKVRDVLDEASDTKV